MARLIQLVGAWYAPAYSFVIRVVQPAAFGALLATLLWIITRTFGDGDTFLLLGLGAVLLYAAHSFVLTPPSAMVSLALVLVWIVIIATGHAEDPWLGIMFIAGLVSAAVRLLAIVGVLGQRRRTGLLHLAIPALIGTVVGIVSPILGLVLYALDRPDDARLVAAVMLSVAGAAALFFAAATYFVERGDRIVRDWSHAHQLAQPAEDGMDVETLLGRFIRGTGPWRGQLVGTRVTVVSGMLQTGYADLPCARLTALTLWTASPSAEQAAGSSSSKRRRGKHPRHRQKPARDQKPARRPEQGGSDLPNVWIRSRSMTLDTIVPETMGTRRLRTESIEVEGSHEIHVADHVDPVEAMAVVDPRVVDVARSLGTFQVLRHDASVTVYDVGTATTPERLDDMLRIAQESAIAFDLLEPTPR